MITTERIEEIEERAEAAGTLPMALYGTEARGLCALAKSALSASRVRVRPLAWDMVGGGLRAGEYRLRAGVWTHGYYWSRGEDEPHTGYSDEDEAKAAAQADHDARILSQIIDAPALEPSPATVTVTVTEGVTPGLVKIITDAQDVLAEYIVPDSGISDFDCVNRLLGVLDDQSNVRFVRNVQAALSQSPTHRNKQTGAEYVLIGFSVMRADWFTAPYPHGPLFTVRGLPVATLHSATEGFVTVPREEFEAEYEEIAR